MNTLQSLFRGLHKSNLAQNSGQLAQLFMQKKKMEQMEQQRELEQAQSIMKNAVQMLDSDSFAVQEEACRTLDTLSRAKPNLFGGQQTNYVKAWNMNRGTEQMDEIKKMIRSIEKLPASQQGALWPKLDSMMRNLPTKSSLAQAQDLANQARDRGQQIQDTLTKAVQSGKFRRMSPEEKKRSPEGALGYGQLRQASTTESGDELAFQKKMGTLMNTIGVDEATAAEIVLGTKKINTNPVTGESVLVDMVTGTSEPIKPTTTQQPTAQPKPQGPTLWEMADLSTGLLSGAKAAWGGTAGQIPGMPIAKRTEYARQRLRSSQNQLIRSLSVNPRFPVAEMKRIKEETRIEPELMDSPQSLRIRMKAVNDYLSGEIAAYERLANDTQMPITNRRDAKQAVEAMKRFVQQLGVPEDFSVEPAQGISKEEQSLIDKYTKGNK